MRRRSEKQSGRAIQKLLTQLNLQQCLSLDECIEMQHTEVGEAAGSEYEWWPGACFRAVAIIHDVADSVQVQALVDAGLQVAAAGRPRSGLGLGKQGGM